MHSMNNVKILVGEGFATYCCVRNIWDSWNFTQSRFYCFFHWPLANYYLLYHIRDLSGINQSQVFLSEGEVRNAETVGMHHNF
jgi:hypothetical protein